MTVSDCDVKVKSISDMETKYRVSFPRKKEDVAREFKKHRSIVYVHLEKFLSEMENKYGPSFFLMISYRGNVFARYNFGTSSK